jgi:23S rRNA pseudouridine2605 synthase
MKGSKKQPYYSNLINKKNKPKEEEKEKAVKRKKIDRVIEKKPITPIKKQEPELKPELKAEPKVPVKTTIRLNAFIAKAGVCSRRQADELIKKGKVTVNGKVIQELGATVNHSDTVEYNGKKLMAETKVYILINKPKDYITTTADEEGRRTVYDLIKTATKERVYPVGRLDRNTTGVLLLTNDGELTEQLTHPRYKKRKIYEVELDKNLSEEDFKKITEGIDLDFGTIKADALQYLDPIKKHLLGIEIHTGQNRVVRNIFETLGYEVKKLDRVYFAGLTKKNLPRGKWRFLTDKEVAFLKMKSFK